MASNPGCVSTLINEKNTWVLHNWNNEWAPAWPTKAAWGQVCETSQKITRDANHVISEPSDPVEKILHLCQVFSSKQTGLNKKLKKIQIVR